MLWIFPSAFLLSGFCLFCRSEAVRLLPELGATVNSTERNN